MGTNPTPEGRRLGSKIIPCQAATGQAATPAKPHAAQTGNLDSAHMPRSLSIGTPPSPTLGSHFGWLTAVGRARSFEAQAHFFTL